MLSELVVKSLPLVPGPIMRRLSHRYIAGETLESALERLRDLKQRRYPGILDILGEEIRSEDEARSVAEQYKVAASALAAEGLDAYVSVKPTHVGLSSSEDLCFELYADIARHCRELGVFLRVEMEDHTTTDGTLRVFERLRSEFEAVGCVLQSRLHRTTEDIANLAPGPLNVRLVKGIYLEPSEIAHTDYQAIRDAYVENARQLVGRGATLSLATHDDWLVEALLPILRENSVTDFEFQVLLGVQQGLWKKLSESGHTVRVYVPYGPDWRAYSTRRLSKNPEIVKHIVRNLFRD